MDSGVAHTLLDISNMKCSEKTIVANYKVGTEKASKKVKAQLNLAFETVASSRKSKFLKNSMPKHIRIKPCPVKLHQVAMSSLCANLYKYAVPITLSRPSTLLILSQSLPS